MINITRLRDKYIAEKFTIADANAKVAQDLVLLKISQINFFNNITIKGGIVMQSISNDYRRATRDMDFDFIKYSLEDESIKKFIGKLNTATDGVTVSIIGDIEILNHQDYKGKRMFVKITDSFKNSITTKFDIGIHKNMEIAQEEYWFNFNSLGETAKLLINSKEQIFVEKLKSLLRFDFISTRYKDIFDFYYLINNTDLDKDKMLKFINIYIIDDKTIKINSVTDIYNRLEGIFSNSMFTENLKGLKNNWLELPINEVTASILEYFKILEVTCV